MTPGPWENPSPAPPPARRQRTASRLGLLLWLAMLGGMILLLVALDRWFPTVRGGSDTANIVQMVAWLALLSSGLLFIRQVNLKQAARNMLLWLGVAGVLLLGYVYQEPLLDMALHLRGALVPGYAVETGLHELTIAESEGGSYLVFGAVNGEPTRFVIDTGASDIVLSPADARRAGIDLAALRYERPYATANGIGYGATTRVASLTVNGFVLRDVEVSVQKAEMGSSLLGMSFLRRLKSFGFGGRKMVLRW